jgi:hypothetical protein
MSTGRVAGTPGSRVREPLLRLQGACVGDETLTMSQWGQAPAIQVRLFGEETQR